MTETVSSRRKEIAISLTVIERHAGYRLVEFPENGRTYAFCACGMTHDLWTEKDKVQSAKMWWLDHIKRIQPPTIGAGQPVTLDWLLLAADRLLDSLYTRETEEVIIKARHDLRTAVAATREEYVKPV